MKKLLITLIVALLALLLSPGVEFRFGGEEKWAEKSDFSLSPDWLEHLENITGMIVQMPNPNYLKSYESSLENSPRIKLQIYEFTEKHLKSKLKSLTENGVKIQIMIENKKYQQFKNTYKELQNYFSGLQNIEVKSDEHLPTQYLHSKITLMQSGFWIQSSNLTHSTFAKNREHLFRSENPKVLKVYIRFLKKTEKASNFLLLICILILSFAISIAVRWLRSWFPERRRALSCRPNISMIQPFLIWLQKSRKRWISKRFSPIRRPISRFLTTFERIKWDWWKSPMCILKWSWLTKKSSSSEVWISLRIV